MRGTINIKLSWDLADKYSVSEGKNIRIQERESDMSDFGCLMPANVNKFVLFEVFADVCGIITLKLIPLLVHYYTEVSGEDLSRVYMKQVELS